MTWTPGHSYVCMVTAGGWGQPQDGHSDVSMMLIYSHVFDEELGGPWPARNLSACHPALVRCCEVPVRPDSRCSKACTALFCFKGAGLPRGSTTGGGGFNGVEEVSTLQLATAAFSGRQQE
jgi:hypothetical protein